MLTFFTAYNKRDVLEQNMLASPCLEKKGYQIIVRPGGISASKTYNGGLREAEHDYIVFLHQDVYLPERWDEKLIKQIKDIESNDSQWAVLGCFGINESGVGSGHVYSNGLGRELGKEGEPEKAMSLDEMLIIINRKSGITFDEGLPGYHLFGTDICLRAKNEGGQSYIIKNFCIHNSLPVVKLDKHFWAGCDYVRKKWTRYLPIKTPCVFLPKSHTKYLYTKLKKQILYIRGAGKRKKATRMEIPTRR